MKARTLRHLIIGLLLATGVFHLAVALLGGGDGRALGLTIFGFIYIALSFYVRSDVKDGSKNHSRNAIIATIIACTAGLGLGGASYVQNGGPMALPLMFLIDLIIIAAGAWWLLKTSAKA
jgi:lipopolysaccharide export LptBFGC system permease protein LptF